MSPPLPLRRPIFCVPNNTHQPSSLSTPHRCLLHFHSEGLYSVYQTTHINHLHYQLLTDVSSTSTQKAYILCTKQHTSTIFTINSSQMSPPLPLRRPIFRVPNNTHQPSSLSTPHRCLLHFHSEGQYSVYQTTHINHLHYQLLTDVSSTSTQKANIPCTKQHTSTIFTINSSQMSPPLPLRRPIFRVPNNTHQPSSLSTPHRCLLHFHSEGLYSVYQTTHINHLHYQLLTDVSSTSTQKAYIPCTKQHTSTIFTINSSQMSPPLPLRRPKFRVPNNTHQPSSLSTPHRCLLHFHSEGLYSVYQTTHINHLHYQLLTDVSSTSTQKAYIPCTKLHHKVPIRPPILLQSMSVYPSRRANNLCQCTPVGGLTIYVSVPQ